MTTSHLKSADPLHRDTLLHELMNRAAPLLALAERLRELPLPDEHRAVLSALYRSSRDVDRLVRSLRDPDDFFTPRKTASDLNAIVGEVVDGLCGVARGAGVRLWLDVGPTARGLVDEVQVAEIVTNLVKNAIEAVPRGGRVIVATTVRGRTVRVTVRDDGPGVSPHVRARLFERGASSKSTASSAPRGIGLSLSRDLARAHGGRLVYRRARYADGVFTEFVLTLPRLREPQAASRADAPKTPRPRVLVVDDDAEVRFALELVLRDGFEVVAVPDGEAALAALARTRFDAMLTDEHLPRGPGGEALAEAARRLQPGLESRTIIVSGSGPLRAAAAPARIPRMRKPFDGAALRAALIERLVQVPARVAAPA